MKKKYISIILMVVVAMAAVFMTACGGSSEPQTLEEYIENNEDLKAELDESISTASESGVEVQIQGNDIIYNFDLSTVTEITEEIAKTDMVKAELESALEQQASTFGNVAAQMEEETGLKGVQVVINYKYGDEVIYSRTFTSADADTAETSDGN